MAEARALAAQERELIVQRAQRFGRGLVIAMATTMTFAALLVVAADQLFRPTAFNIENLKISGKFRHTSPEQIQAFVRAQPLGNFFSLDLARLQTGLEKLPWVEMAQVRRVWPDTLSIRVSEHRPVMRWQDVRPAKGHNTDESTESELWLSTSGEVISVPKFASNPQAITLVGQRSHSKQMMRAALRWKQQLIKVGLTPLQVVQGESGAWRLTLASRHQDAPFELLLGSQNVPARLQRFQYLYDTEFRFTELALSRVDARYPNGLAVEHTAIAQGTKSSFNTNSTANSQG